MRTWQFTRLGNSEWFRAFVGYALSVCRPLRPRGSFSAASRWSGTSVPRWASSGTTRLSLRRERSCSGRQISETKEPGVISASYSQWKSFRSSFSPYWSSKAVAKMH
jgi:hypothetical protein